MVRLQACSQAYQPEQSDGRKLLKPGGISGTRVRINPIAIHPNSQFLTASHAGRFSVILLAKGSSVAHPHRQTARKLLQSSQVRLIALNDLLRTNSRLPQPQVNSLLS